MIIIVANNDYLWKKIVMNDFSENVIVPHKTFKKEDYPFKARKKKPKFWKGVYMYVSIENKHNKLYGNFYIAKDSLL